MTGKGTRQNFPWSFSANLAWDASSTRSISHGNIVKENKRATRLPVSPFTSDARRNGPCYYLHISSSMQLFLRALWCIKNCSLRHATLHRKSSPPSLRFDACWVAEAIVVQQPLPLSANSSIQILLPSKFSKCNFFENPLMRVMTKNHYSKYSTRAWYAIFNKIFWNTSESIFRNISESIFWNCQVLYPKI